MQIHATGRNSEINRADSFFGIYPATAPDHSCMHTDGASPLRYAFPAAQYSSRNAVGPYLQYSRGWPSDPGALPFGCRRVCLSNDSKSIVRLMRGRDPAGILRITSSTCLGMGQGGIGAIAGLSHIDWQCSQKNLTALVGLPNLCWVALVLSTCKPGCRQVGHTEYVSIPSLAMCHSWTESISSGRIAMYLPGG